MLEFIFGNVSAEKALFYLRLNGQGYAKAMARRLGCALTPLQAQLKRMERGGIVVSRSLGRTRLYQINPAYYYATELAALLDRALEAMPPTLRLRYEDRQRPRRAGKP